MLRPTDWAGLAFFLLAAQFVTVITLAASAAPGYDLAGGAISDLGVIAETALLFNAALLLVGLLNLFGAYYAYRLERGRLLFGICGIASIGAIGAGLMPLSTGGWHGIFALLAFVFFNLEVIGQAMRTDLAALRWTGLVLATVGLVHVVLMAIGDAGNPLFFGPIGHGGVERLIVYPPMLWLMVYGGFRLGRPIPTA
ncbi:MAG: DUF998 domain-containing protein [Devosia sp.]|nr:DUF998 domain-containing protein [Devosia sp.]